jgi:hypothetical protein
MTSVNTDDFAPEIRRFLELFEYRNGDLYRKHGQFAGKAGTLHHTGYTQVKVGKKNYRAHRIIFAMHHGYFPDYVDHIDGNRLNNRIENLREATNQQNQYNVGLISRNKSGAKNVVWDRNRWKVYMRINKKMTHIGAFEDFELAELVATEARNKFHGEFVKHD